MSLITFINIFIILGGPLAQGNTVVGVISWGIPCATGSPDVYARIASHRPWITGIAGA